jgi:thiosulfate/3-mercaptopyruvate sulfurtransferase
MISYIGPNLGESKGKVTAFHVIRVIPRFVHDLSEKPVPAFPDHALASAQRHQGGRDMAEQSELITTAELADILTRPDLRLFDCTTYLEPAPEGSGIPYLVVSGRQTFEAGHIPGANFLDLQAEFSDSRTELRFMMPPVAQLEAAFGRHGISANSRVVLYSIGTAMWATRFWWMLHALGFTGASVLDGGIDKWTAEGRDIESGLAGGYPPATFAARPKAGLFVGKHDVLAATADAGAVVVNALGPQFYKGLEPSRYGRPGRIPGSVSVPAASMIDPRSKTFLPLADAERIFAAQGITKDKRVIAYCGGGISATIDLLQLHRLGYDDLTLYDGSMGEWAKDESLPIETG